MGTPRGTEPMDMLGDDDMMGMDMDMMGMDMMGMDMDMMDDDDVMMDDKMLMMIMQEDKKAKPDFLDLDGDGDKEESMKKAAKDKEEEMDEGEVIGVDSNIRKQRMMKESYKAVSAKPSRDSWGNEYNKILTESSQVEGIKSLMERMKK